MTVNTTSRAVWRGRKLLAEKQLTDPHHFSGNHWPVNISLWGKSWGPYKSGVVVLGVGGFWGGAEQCCPKPKKGRPALNIKTLQYSNCVSNLGTVDRNESIGALSDVAEKQTIAAKIKCRCGSTPASLLPFVGHLSYKEKHRTDQKEEEQNREREEKDERKSIPWQAWLIGGLLDNFIRRLY